MKKMKKLFAFASVSFVLEIFLASSLCAQENASPAEPTKIEAPATSSAAPEVEATKEDLGAVPAQFTQGLLEQIGGAKVAIDTMWVLIAGMLVFFMNLGFASVESGLCRAKNAVTILAKNFVVFAASSISFLILGWGLMFGDGNPFFGT
jgi:ammonium transporter, Amt family